MKLVQCKEYLIKTVDTDGLVFYHSVEYAPKCFQLFMG